MNKDGTVIYQSGMNPRIYQNARVFTPCDLIAAITQHIPDKILQLVRYYKWYSNKIWDSARNATRRWTKR